MEITREELLKNGWYETEDPVLPLSKKLPNQNPLNPEDSLLELIAHSYYNEPAIGLLLPNGAIINLNISTIQELITFEKMINFYDPEF